MLTRRERDILTLVALGNTSAEIAARLALSPATVQTHMIDALTILKAKNRAHGIAIALQSGEITLDEVQGEPPFRGLPSPVRGELQSGARLDLPRSQDSEEIRRLREQNLELRRANENLDSASSTPSRPS